MPFYAYAVSRNRGAGKKHRYLLIFPSQGVADEWWRAIQDNVANKLAGWDHFKRITPELYSHDPDIKWINGTVGDSPNVQHFFDKIIFQTLTDETAPFVGTVIPIQEITDHLSGQEFYIRSKRDPTFRWHTTRSQIVATRKDNPTRFLIQRKADPTDTKTILIDSDEILISVPSAGTRDINVSTSSDGKLVLGRFPETFKFGDLKNGFKVLASSVTDDEGPAKALLVQKTNDGRGELWELA